MPEGLDNLIAACRRNDREAQRLLYERCVHRVYRLAVRIVGERDAEDVTQEVFLRLFQKIQQFHGHSTFDTWLYRLTVNECLQHLRREKRRTARDRSQQRAEATRSPELAAEQQEIVSKALQRLPADLRAILLLREVEGLDYQQLGEVLGIAGGTVASRLNRARERLRQALTDLGYEP